ncbi:MAG: hypothetical protein ACK5LZ_06125 [Anaerorhabdus sp.]
MFGVSLVALPAVLENFLNLPLFKMVWTLIAFWGMYMVAQKIMSDWFEYIKRSKRSGIGEKMVMFIKEVVPEMILLGVVIIVGFFVPVSQVIQIAITVVMMGWSVIVEPVFTFLLGVI